MGKLKKKYFNCYNCGFVQDIIAIFGSSAWFLVSANLMMSSIFTPCQPLLPWQRNFGQNNEIWEILA